jgi:hypothetical protein
MDAILLKRKPDTSVSAENNETLVVFDELIHGVLHSGEWFAPVFTESKGGLKFMPLSYLIENFLFPKGGKQQPRMISFMSGFNPDVKFDYYQSDEVEI